MTKNMLAALKTAEKQQTLRRTHIPGPGEPKWPTGIHPSTLAALVKTGLLQLGEIRDRNGYKVTTWTPTDAGREALKPKAVIHKDTPRFMRRPSRSGGDYSASHIHAIDELEAVDPGEIGEAWFGRAARKYAEAMDRRGAARMIARQRRAA